MEKHLKGNNESNDYKLKEYKKSKVRSDITSILISGLLITSLINTVRLNNNITKFQGELDKSSKELIGMVEAYDNLRNTYESDIENYKYKITNLEENILEIKKDYTELEYRLKDKEEETKKLKEANNKVTRGSRRGEVYFEVSMYTNDGGDRSVDNPNYGRMANGEFTHEGAVAAPKRIPFGTKIRLLESKNGFESLIGKDLTVKDRGGAIVEKIVDGKHVYSIDIYTPDKNTARNWGRRVVKGIIE